MYKGTTPTLSLTFGEGVDFTDASSIVVTFTTDYRRVIAEKSGDDLIIDGNVIKIEFTQKETLSLMTGTMLVQVNVLYEDGTRVSSNIESINWIPNLKNEVME